MALSGGQLTLTKHPVGCLMIFPRQGWLEFREKLIALPFEADAWRRVFIGWATDVEIDGASRILVSPELRATTGITRDALMLGVGSRLELWDPVRHAAVEAATVAMPMPAAIQGFVF